MTEKEIESAVDRIKRENPELVALGRAIAPMVNERLAKIDTSISSDTKLAMKRIDDHARRAALKNVIVGN